MNPAVVISAVFGVFGIGCIVAAACLRHRRRLRTDSSKANALLMWLEVLLWVNGSGCCVSAIIIYLALTGPK
jgi:uncharacterized membrane protein YhaH (DUF805 family)